MSRVALHIVLAALLAGTGQVALAQEDTAADRADARLARQDRILDEPRTRPGLAGEGQLPPPFTFTLSAPITYNSNIDNADDGGRNDLHTNPSAVLDYAQQTGSVRLIGRLAADVDDYFEHEENDASTLIGRIGLKIIDPKLGGFAPYAHYTPILIFGRHFEDHQLTIHAFTLGVSGKIPAGKILIKPDLQIVRREATNALAERNQLGGGITLLGDIVPDRVSWSLGQTIQARHYTGSTNSGRDDLNFNTSGSISVVLNKLFSLEFNASFEHNASDRSGKDYSVFDIGPSIVFSVPFGSTPAPVGPGGAR